MECVLCGRGEDTSHVVNDIKSTDRSIIQTGTNDQSVSDTHHIATISRLVAGPILDPAAISRATGTHTISDEVRDDEWD